MIFNDIDLSNKALIVKCRLLNDFSLIIKKPSISVTVVKGGIDIDFGVMRASFDFSSMKVKEVFLNYFDELFLCKILSDLDMIEIIEQGVFTGLTHIFDIEGKRVLVDNFNKVVFVCEKEEICVRYAFHSRIQKVFLENGMIGMQVCECKYVIDMDSFECFLL